MTDQRPRQQSHAPRHHLHGKPVTRRHGDLTLGLAEGQVGVVIDEDQYNKSQVLVSYNNLLEFGKDGPTRVSEQVDYLEEVQGVHPDWLKLQHSIGPQFLAASKAKGSFTFTACSAAAQVLIADTYASKEEYQQAVQQHRHSTGGENMPQHYYQLTGYRKKLPKTPSVDEQLYPTFMEKLVQYPRLAAREPLAQTGRQVCEYLEGDHGINVHKSWMQEICGSVLGSGRKASPVGQASTPQFPRGAPKSTGGTFQSSSSHRQAATPEVPHPSTPDFPHGVDSNWVNRRANSTSGKGNGHSRYQQNTPGRQPVFEGGKDHALTGPRRGSKSKKARRRERIAALKRMSDEERALYFEADERENEVNLKKAESLQLSADRVYEFGQDLKKTYTETASNYGDQKGFLLSKHGFEESDSGSEDNDSDSESGEQNNGVAPEIQSGYEELESDNTTFRQHDGTSNDQSFGNGQETPPSQDMKDSPQRVERETFGENGADEESSKQISETAKSGGLSFFGRRQDKKFRRERSPQGSPVADESPDASSSSASDSLRKRRWSPLQKLISSPRGSTVAGESLDASPSSASGSLHKRKWSPLQILKKRATTQNQRDTDSSTPASSADKVDSEGGISNGESSATKGRRAASVIASGDQRSAVENTQGKKNIQQTPHGTPMPSTYKKESAPGNSFADDESEESDVFHDCLETDEGYPTEVDGVVQEVENAVQEVEDGERVLVDVPPDGNCLFHATGLQVGRDHKDLRAAAYRRVVNYVQHYRDEEAPNGEIDAFLTAALEEGEDELRDEMQFRWGTDLGTIALAEELGRPIVVISQELVPNRGDEVRAQYYHAHFKDLDGNELTGDPIVIYYNGVHYQMLVPLDQMVQMKEASDCLPEWRSSNDSDEMQSSDGSVSSLVEESATNICESPNVHGDTSAPDELRAPDRFAGGALRRPEEAAAQDMRPKDGVEAADAADVDGGHKSKRAHFHSEVPSPENYGTPPSVGKGKYKATSDIALRTEEGGRVVKYSGLQIQRLRKKNSQTPAALQKIRDSTPAKKSFGRDIHRSNPSSEKSLSPAGQESLQTARKHAIDGKTKRFGPRSERFVYPSKQPEREAVVNSVWRKNHTCDDESDLDESSSDRSSSSGGGANIVQQSSADLPSLSNEAIDDSPILAKKTRKGTIHPPALAEPKPSSSAVEIHKEGDDGTKGSALKRVQAKKTSNLRKSGMSIPSAENLKCLGNNPDETFPKDTAVWVLPRPDDNSKISATHNGKSGKFSKNVEAGAGKRPSVLLQLDAEGKAIEPPETTNISKQYLWVENKSVVLESHYEEETEVSGDVHGEYAEASDNSDEELGGDMEEAVAFDPDQFSQRLAYDDFRDLESLVGRFVKVDKLGVGKVIELGDGSMVWIRFLDDSEKQVHFLHISVNPDDN